METSQYWQELGTNLQHLLGPQNVQNLQNAPNEPQQKESDSSRQSEPSDGLSQGHSRPQESDSPQRDSEDVATGKATGRGRTGKQSSSFGEPSHALLSQHTEPVLTSSASREAP